MTLANQIINNIGKLMLKGGVTQTELSRRTGINQPQLNGYLKGKNQPGIEIIEKIASAFGLVVKDLIGEESPKLGPTPEERLRLEAIAGILSLDRREDLETVLDALKPFLDRARKKNQRRASGP